MKVKELIALIEAHGLHMVRQKGSHRPALSVMCVCVDQAQVVVAHSTLFLLVREQLAV